MNTAFTCSGDMLGWVTLAMMRFRLYPRRAWRPFWLR
jgi:hypothetical protein